MGEIKFGILPINPGIVSIPAPPPPEVYDVLGTENNVAFIIEPNQYIVIV